MLELIMTVLVWVVVLWVGGIALLTLIWWVTGLGKDPPWKED